MSSACLSIPPTELKSILEMSNNSTVEQSLVQNRSLSLLLLLRLGEGITGNGNVNGNVDASRSEKPDIIVPLVRPVTFSIDEQGTARRGG